MRRFRKNWMAVFSVGFILFCILAAILAPLLHTHDPNAFDFNALSQKLGTPRKFTAAETAHLEELGRELTRCIQNVMPAASEITQTMKTRTPSRPRTVCTTLVE